MEMFVGKMGIHLLKKLGAGPRGFPGFPSFGVQKIPGIPGPQISPEIEMAWNGRYDDPLSHLGPLGATWWSRGQQFRNSPDVKLVSPLVPKNMFNICLTEWSEFVANIVELNDLCGAVATFSPVSRHTAPCSNRNGFTGAAFKDLKNHRKLVMFWFRCPTCTSLF